MLLVARGQPMWDVGSGTPSVVNNGGTSFVSQGALSDTEGITCYTDFFPDGHGVCNVLGVSGANDTAITVGPDYVFNANLTEYISVAPLSATTAVVCYSDSGNTKLVTCAALQMQGDSLQRGEPVHIDMEAELSPYISVSGLSESLGLVCYTCNGCTSQDRRGLCAVLELSGTTLAVVGDRFALSGSQVATHISVQGFTASSAVVCYSKQGDGTCALLSVSTSSISSQSEQVFHSGSVNFFNTIRQAKVSETSGVLCYADALNDQNRENFAACGSFEIAGSTLSLGNTEVVNNGTSTFVSVAPLTSQGGGDGAIVCYADLGMPINGIPAGPGTCKVLDTWGDSVVVGAANLVRDSPTERVSLSALSADVAVMCYTDEGAGPMSCRTVSVVPITTTTTLTSTLTETGTSTTSTSESTDGLPSSLTSTSPHTIQIAGGVSSSRVYLSSTPDGSNVDLHDVDEISGRQRWILMRGGDIGIHSWYHIVVLDGVSGDGKYLSSTPDGSNVHLHDVDEGSGRQRWTLTKGSGDWFIIRVLGGVSTGRAFLSSTPDGSNVDLHDVDEGSGRQRWRIEPKAYGDHDDEQPAHHHRRLHANLGHRGASESSGSLRAACGSLLAATAATVMVNVCCV
jgi:hypothetical protein